MFKLIKKLFSKSKAKQQEEAVTPKPKPLVLTNPTKYKDEIKVQERPAKPAPTKPAESKPVAKKSAAKKSSAPKTKTAKKAPAKKTAIKIEQLEKMTKAELDEYATKNFGIKLDRRKRKADMIADFVEAKRNKKQK